MRSKGCGIGRRRITLLTGGEQRTRARVQQVPGIVLRGVGLFNPAVRELMEMLYEFEEPFVVDHRKYARAFGDHTTLLDQAIINTLAWYQPQARARSAA